MSAYVLTATIVVFLPVLPFISMLLKKTKIDFKKDTLPAVLSVTILGIVAVLPFTVTPSNTFGDTVTFLNRVLSFLLPLHLTACIAKNKIGLAKFRSLCTEFLELNWQILALVKSDEKSNQELSNLLLKLPTVIKYDMRGGATLKGAELGFEVDKNLPGNLSEQLLQILHKKIGDFTTADKPLMNIPSTNNMFRTLNKITALYSDIKSIHDYMLPDIFFGFFYVCIGAYFTMLPFTYTDDAGVIFLKCYVQLYVFMGMFLVGLYVENAFKSSGPGLTTVSSIYKEYKVNFNQVENDLISITYAFNKRYY